HWILAPNTQLKGHEGKRLYEAPFVQSQLDENIRQYPDVSHLPGRTVAKAHTPARPAAKGKAGALDHPGRNAHRREILDRYEESPEADPDDDGQGGLSPETIARMSRFLDTWEQAIREGDFGPDVAEEF